MHGVTGDFSFPGAAWADYMDLQAGNEVDHATVHAIGLVNRAFTAKPLIQEEHGLGQEDLAHRQKAWAAFTGGAAGVGTGAFLRHLAAFVAPSPSSAWRRPAACCVPARPTCSPSRGRSTSPTCPWGGRSVST